MNLVLGCIVLFLILVQASGHCYSVKSNRSPRVTIDRKLSFSIDQCQKECSELDECESFFFSAARSTCVLLSHHMPNTYSCMAAYNEYVKEECTEEPSTAEVTEVPKSTATVEVTDTPGPTPIEEGYIQNTLFDSNQTFIVPMDKLATSPCGKGDVMLDVTLLNGTNIFRSSNLLTNFVWNSNERLWNLTENNEWMLIKGAKCVNAAHQNNCTPLKKETKSEVNDHVITSRQPTFPSKGNPCSAKDYVQYTSIEYLHSYFYANYVRFACSYGQSLLINDFVEAGSTTIVESASCLRKNTNR